MKNAKPPSTISEVFLQKNKGQYYQNKAIKFYIPFSTSKKHNGGAFKGVALVSTETPLEKISRFATGVTL